MWQCTWHGLNLIFKVNQDWNTCPSTTRAAACVPPVHRAFLPCPSSWWRLRIAPQVPFFLFRSASLWEGEETLRVPVALGCTPELSQLQEPERAEAAEKKGTGGLKVKLTPLPGPQRLCSPSQHLGLIFPCLSDSLFPGQATLPHPHPQR